MADTQDLMQRKNSITQLVKSKENAKAYDVVERKLLGKIIFLSNDDATNRSKIHELNDYVFHNKLYKRIFQIEKSIIEKGLNIDVMDIDTALVNDENSLANELYEKNGSFLVLKDLMNAAGATSAGIDNLFKKIVKLYQKDSLINETINFLNKLDLNKDPKEIERDFLKISEKLSQLNETGDNTAQPFKEILESWNQLIYEQRLSGINLGTNLGYKELDKKIGGIRPGQFLVLGARPGTGKTAFALNLIQNLIRNDKKKNILMFSLEMNSFELIERIVSMNTGINNRLIRTNQLDDLQWADISTYVNENKDNVSFYINDNPSLSMDKIETEINKVLEQVDQIDLVVIDYLQLINSSNRERQQAIAEISRRSKLLAKKYQLPLLALSQLNREGSGRGQNRPGLQNLRESGQIEQDADIVMMLSPKEETDADDSFNEDNQLQGDDSDAIAQIVCDIVKNRSGNRGETNFIFHKDISYFKEDDSIKQNEQSHKSDPDSNNSVNIGDIFK